MDGLAEIGIAGPGKRDAHGAANAGSRDVVQRGDGGVAEGGDVERESAPSA